MWGGGGKDGGEDFLSRVGRNEDSGFTDGGICGYFFRREKNEAAGCEAGELGVKKVEGVC